MTWAHAKNVYLGAGYLPHGINNLISLKISCNETPSVVWLLFPSGIAADALLFPRPPTNSAETPHAVVDDFSRALARRWFCWRDFLVSLPPIILPWLTANRRQLKNCAGISFHALLLTRVFMTTYEITVTIRYYIQCPQWSYALT